LQNTQTRFLKKIGFLEIEPLCTEPSNYKDVKKWRHKSIRAHVVMAVVLTAATLKRSRSTVQ